MRLVDVEFLSVDGYKPPYPHFKSAPGICYNLEMALGKRKIIQSVKNGKLMSKWLDFSVNLVICH